MDKNRLLYLFDMDNGEGAIFNLAPGLAYLAGETRRDVDALNKLIFLSGAWPSQIEIQLKKWRRDIHDLLSFYQRHSRFPYAELL